MKRIILFAAAPVIVTTLLVVGRWLDASHRYALSVPVDPAPASAPVSTESTREPVGLTLDGSETFEPLQAQPAPTPRDTWISWQLRVGYPADVVERAWERQDVRDAWATIEGHRAVRFALVGWLADEEARYEARLPSQPLVLDQDWIRASLDDPDAFLELVARYEAETAEARLTWGTDAPIHDSPPALTEALAMLSSNTRLVEAGETITTALETDR